MLRLKINIDGRYQRHLDVPGEVINQLRNFVSVSAVSVITY